jgi:hypothetical protein
MWHGTISGRVGEIVGSRWKGINYIKTYTKPVNPRTLLQQETRYTFAFIGEMASAFAIPVLNGNMFPHPRKMSRMNATVKENSHFIRRREVIIQEMQIFPPNMETDIIIDVNVDSYETFMHEIELDVSVSNLSMYRRRPDAIAFGFYNRMLKIWYGIGALPVRSTSHAELYIIVIPIQVLGGNNEAILLGAPVWYPNPALNLSGGNGRTNAWWHGILPPWKPDPAMLPLAKLAELKAIQEKSTETYKQVSAIDRQKAVSERAERAKKEGRIVYDITGRGLESEIARLEKVEKRSKATKTKDEGADTTVRV